MTIYISGTGYFDFLPLPGHHLPPRALDSRAAPACFSYAARAINFSFGCRDRAVRPGEPVTFSCQFTSDSENASEPRLRVSQRPKGRTISSAVADALVVTFPSNTAFNLLIDQSGTQTSTTFNRNGYATRLRVGSGTPTVLKSSSGNVDLLSYSMSFSSISLNAVVFAVKVTNSGTQSQTISLAVDADTQFDSVHAPMSALEGGRGILMSSSDYDFTFVLRNSSLVRNVSTYCFGSYSNRSSNYWTQTTSFSCSGDSGVTFSWQGLTVDAGASVCVSALFLVGQLSPDRPILDMGSTPAILGSHF
jgi:hypothetical protein